ncbi:MAG: hydroxypyruvate isomerase, partial [Acidocella sp. 21-58-7]
MPRFAANLSMMFNEVGFLDRFDAAARVGFRGVEFLFPYEHPAAEIRRRLDANGLTQALFNMPPGDWAKGERGLAALPGRQAEFREGVARALDYAAALDCKLVHCMAGIVPAGVAPATAAAVYAANLAWAGEQALKAGVRLAIEPINHRDMPGYFLNTQAQGAAIVEAIGRDRIGLQFDVYHVQVTEGDITKRMEQHLPVIVHMQIAD